MKLLLTSVGLSNDAIRGALDDLLARPAAECRAVHVPTAVYAMPGGPAYATEMTRYWAELGWAQLGTLELTALPSLAEEHWRPDLEAADVILVAGGNTGYLSYWFHRSGFAEALPPLLDRAVYVGVSAGSMLVTPALNYDRDRYAETGVSYDDEYDEAAPQGAGDHRALGLVNFHLRPHLDSEDFPDMSLAAMGRAAVKVDGPLYAIDDRCAIVVDGDRVEVVGGGAWHLFNDQNGEPGV